MTDIEILERAIDYVGVKYINGTARAYMSPILVKAIHAGLTALRTPRPAGVGENEPLTLDDLREMDGKPVWIDFIQDASGEPISFWALVSVDEGLDEIYFLNNLGGSSAYEEVWSDIRAIYRLPPKSK